MRSNCFLWAFALYWRRRRKGHAGYIVIRHSRWGTFPHALYAERRKDGSLRVVAYVPRDPRFKNCPPPLFSGAAKWGDL